MRIKAVIRRLLRWTCASDSRVVPDAPDEARRSGDARFRSAYMRSHTPGFQELNVTTKEGNRVPIEWANVHLKDDTSIGIGVDVSERKQAELALRDANARLEEADRRKNEFLAVLSHELRNPLAPITNSLYILDHTAPASERAYRAKQTIARQVVQLSNLVNDLLDVTRITRNKIHLQPPSPARRWSPCGTTASGSRRNLARLFHPFMQADQTLDRSKGGLGLGLALVKGLVELHGGTISAHSEGLGRGSTFVVQLPLASGAGAEPTAGRVPIAAQPRRLLIIEDNTDAADSLCEALAMAGHEVETAYNGRDGVARARLFRPDVVLCDLGLPGMDGYQVARAVRTDPDLRSTCLVALSGYALPDDIRGAMDAGFDRHLPKPPTMAKIDEVLSELAVTKCAAS